MKHFLPVAATATLCACATTPSSSPQDMFFDRLAAQCGRAFEGRVASPPVEADRDFAGKRIVMHVRDCSPEEIRIPVSVGEDRSRTWVFTRGGREGALTLKHDHRHSDGSPDAVTNYGGTATAAGTPARQEFPADDFSRDLFVRENIPVSVANVWAAEIHPGETFAYELRRPGRFFRLEFDLSRPLPGPPAS